MEQQPNKTKDKLKEITEGIERGIQELFESDRYKQYLRVMSRFHQYSLNNTLLIAMQRPDATLVCGYTKWDKEFGRNVMRGEKSIKIIAPTPYKVKREREKLDPDTKAPMLDAEGKIVTEEVEVKIPMYRVASVFDVSQTEGRPLPSLAADLAGDVKQYEIFMEALRRSAPVPLRIEKMRENLDGFFRQPTDEHPDVEKFIAIREGMSEVQTVCAAIHEIGHAKLHDREQARLAAQADPENPPKPKDKNTREVEAESVSYAVCQYYSIETGENSLGYIATWSKDKTLPELRDSLDTINRTADGLITDIDRHFAEICKERGIDLSTPEQPDEKTDDLTEEPSSAPPLPADYPMPDPDVTMEEMHDYGYTDGDMLPLTYERAIDLFEQDLSVYMLYGGNGAGMVFDRKDLDTHDGMFAVSREEWEENRDSILSQPPCAFAIYQLKQSEENHAYAFRPLKELRSSGLTPERDRYELKYSDVMTEQGSTAEKLNSLFQRFNLNRPADFTGHSLSVSDIIVLRQPDAITYHYVDSWGFPELSPDFKPLDNYLKNTEMSVEDDYGMIDGIINNGQKPTVAELEKQATSGQPISLMDLADAVHREQTEKRQSVMQQLKAPPKQEHKRTAPKGAEMER